jgi:DNA processing protein
MEHDPRAWLILALAHVRVPEFQRLSELFGDEEAIVTQPLGELKAAGLADEKCAMIVSPDEQLVDQAIAWQANVAHHLIAYGESDYPELLSQIPGPPLLLYVNGNLDALHLPALAIIGSRNPTQGGVRNAVEFARHLAGRGFTIVSGLAQGIDTAAHRGALDGNGHTLALLGHGIDRVYPAANHKLAHAIAAKGALITEYPLGAQPERWHFPERNRLISGLSLGTLVIEAARRSGSLITARLAADQGREVFALPGSIHNPLARGCHALIRQGAKLVETADDIMTELAPLTGHLLQSTVHDVTPDAPPPTLDDDYVNLLRLLSHDPLSIDELAQQSSLTIEQLSSMLLILELHGKVESLSGGRYALVG